VLGIGTDTEKVVLGTYKLMRIFTRGWKNSYFVIVHPDVSHPERVSGHRVLSVGSSIGTASPKNVTHSRAWNDFKVTTTHPHLDKANFIFDFRRKQFTPAKKELVGVCSLKSKKSDFVWKKFR